MKSFPLYHLHDPVCFFLHNLSTFLDDVQSWVTEFHTVIIALLQDLPNKGCCNIYGGKGAMEMSLNDRFVNVVFFNHSGLVKKIHSSKKEQI